MKNYILMGAGAAALAASGYAVAGPGMDKMDVDNDGRFTRAEATMASDKMFKKMDANGDGMINAADREARKREKFDEIDSNSDGKLTAAEMQAHHEAKLAERRARMAEKQAEHFARIDTDGDKALSFEEFESAHAKMRDGKGGKDGMRGAGRHGRFGGGDGDHRGGWGMLGRADTDKDGSVSAEEARAAALARFDKIDTDKDGVISEAEKKAARAAHRDQWKKRNAKSE